jgi:hypothetical protein
MKPPGIEPKAAWSEAKVYSMNTPPTVSIGSVTSGRAYVPFSVIAEMR